MTIRDGLCPYCKLVVRYDDEEKSIAHEGVRGAHREGLPARAREVACREGRN